jgi:hypothetical protein
MRFKIIVAVPAATAEGVAPRESSAIGAPARRTTAGGSAHTSQKGLRRESTAMLAGAFDRLTYPVERDL